MGKTGTAAIKTERLKLRKILPHDYFAVSKWYTNPDIARFSKSKKPPTKWQVFCFTAGRLRRYIKNDYYYWAIVFNGKMVGFVELIPIKSENNKKSYSLSYKLDISLNNKGIMTEAVRAVIEYARTQNIYCIFGVCDAENIGSKRVMEKANMVSFGNPETDAPLIYDDGTSGKRLKYRIKLSGNKDS